MQAVLKKGYPSLQEMGETPNKYLALCIYLVLTLATLAVFQQVREYDFVNYDDQVYVTGNQHIRAGLTRESVVWAFTTPHSGHWHPLTSLSHMLDCHLFGLRAGAHHLTSVLFHIANTLLLFGVLKQMTGALWRSAFVGALFALHPFHVESVAWISERKDVLSTLFWMLTMAGYLRYVKHPNTSRYLLTLLVFALGLMAKPMLVTLPFVLLLLDYWPLQRFQLDQAVKNVNRRTRKSVDTDSQWRVGFRLIREKIPFFALSAISSVITFLVMQSRGIVLGTQRASLDVRVANALISYVKYIGKTIWPSRLAVFYPHPFGTVSIWHGVVSALLVLCISIFVIRLARSHKYLPVGWLWYLGTFVPVIGFVQVGEQAMADRYSYVPLTGLFIIAGWGFSDLVSRCRFSKIILAASALIVILALSICSGLQARHWRNSITLCEHAINVTDDNFLAYNGLGAELCRQNKLDEGIAYLEKALRIMPSQHNANFNMATALARQGKFEGAIEHYQQALRIEPDNIETQKGLAAVIEDQRKTGQAMSYYTRADTLADQSRFDEAVKYYKEAIELKPNFIAAHGRLGLVLAKQGKIDEAIEEFRAVLAERPDDVEMHCNLGILLERQGKVTEAISQYRRALQLNPDYTKAGEHLQAALAKQGNR